MLTAILEKNLLHEGSSKFNILYTILTCSHKKLSWWKALGRCLIDEGYLEEVVLGQGYFGSTVNVSQKARTWMDKGRFSYGVLLSSRKYRH